MKKITDLITRNLEKVVSLDLRSLAIFRIALGIVLVIDMIDRLKDVKLFYSDSGIPGIQNLVPNLFTQTSFSINNLSGDATFQALILLVTLVLSILFLIGYRTRIVTILVWFLVVSIQNRNFIILQGGDDYIRIVLFWAMFLPLAERFSWDAIFNKKLKDNRYISPINIAYIFQIIFLYYFAALEKSDPIWYRDYTALHYALNLDIFVTPLGRFLYSLTDLLKPLTAFVYNIELNVGALLAFPVFNHITRTLGVLLIIGLHIGIGATLDVGPFPWISIAAIIALIPTEAMDKLAELYNKYLSKKADKVKLIAKIKKFTGSVKKKEFTETKLTRYLQFLNSFTLTLVAVSLTFIIFIWNVNNVKYTINLGEKAISIVNFLRLDQNWSMFSPYPFVDDGWYVISGELENGEEVSLWGIDKKTSVNEKPENYYNYFPNERWRKFMNNLWYDSNHQYRERYLEFMCLEWNSTHDVKMNGIYMNYILERTLPPEVKIFPTENRALAKMDCTSLHVDLPSVSL